MYNAESIPRAPKDPIYGLMDAYEADLSPKKVDLGVGAYRDENGKPWILPVVQKVCIPLPNSIESFANISIFRPRKSCTIIPTRTMNICPSPDFLNLFPLHRA